jgi:opacity protein-like surface antigen
MFGLRFGWKQALAVGLVVTAGMGTRAEAQSPRRVRRESSASRKARIQRTIEETYTHKQEVSGGGGFLRFRPGQYLRRSNEVTFYLNDTYYFTPKLAVLADVHGAYGRAQIGNTIYNIPNPQISEYIFSAGPSYRFYAKQNVAASVFATGGVGYGKFGSGSKAIPPTLIGIWPDAWRPAFTAGVSLDYNFYPNLAARITPTYIGTNFGGTFEHNLGFNLGLVYRFGRQNRK